MSEDKQIKLIAECCGYKNVKQRKRDFQITGTFNKVRVCVPHYTRCLNAMHEAERVIKKTENAFSHGSSWRLYETMLSRIVSGENGMFHISAAQRAEAFLKALGLWSDTL